MSETLKKIVVDCKTGKQTILPLTPAEIAQRDQDAAHAAELEAQRQAEELAKGALQASAFAKLEALGLTAEEAATIIEG